jgi:hypothetical protein
MGMIQREIDRIRKALLLGDERRIELYAAQQALEWALEPDGIMSPASMILGTQEGSANYSASRHPLGSADSRFQTDSEPLQPTDYRCQEQLPKSSTSQS